jgi:hypothetical protein
MNDVIGPVNQISAKPSLCDNTKNLRSRIREVESSLKWPLTRIRGRVGPGIESDVSARTHTIYLPEHAIRAIDYLHELAHAHLAEEIEGAFVGLRIVAATALQGGELPVRVLQVVADWFADERLFSWAPAEMRKKLVDDIHVVRTRCHDTALTRTDLLTYVGALFLAQGARYLFQPVHICSPVKDAVDILLGEDPSRPSINRLVELSAALCEMAGYRAEWLPGHKAWHVRALGPNPETADSDYSPERDETFGWVNP